MKSCFNIVRGFVSFLLTIIYWVFLSVSLIILPISFVIKNSISLNKALDELRIEEQFVYLISGTPNPEVSELTPEEQIPEIDLYELFDDPEIQKELINTRRDIITQIYESIKTNEPFRYEVDLEFFNTIYKGVMGQYFENLEVCNTWPTDVTIDLSTETGCLPAPIAYANDIELPEGVDVPAEFEITDDLKLENIVDYQKAVDEGIAELPIITIDQETISALNRLQFLMDKYLMIFIIVTLVLVASIIIIFPNLKAILIFLGIVNLISSIFAVIIWAVPSIFMDQVEKSMIEQGFEGSYFQLFEDLIMNMTQKALIACACVGIIGLALIVLGIILPKRENGESEKQST